jgi:hypothetical protein
MKKKIFLLIISLLLTIAVSFYYVKHDNDSAHIAQQQIGVMIQQLTLAIKTPTSKQSSEIIYQYGSDSRYYVMVRGWLIQTLNGIESQLAVQQHKDQKIQLSLQVEALKSAIRSIDLE